MKQLIQSLTYNSGDFSKSLIVLGLDHRALVINDQGQLCWELAAASVSVVDASKKDNNTTADEDATTSPAATTNKTTADQDAATEPTAACNNNNAIQAVAITTTTEEESTTVVWLAVARQDKSLALYRTTTTTTSKEQHQSSSESSTLQPVTVHRTAKRVSCLEFATLPSSSAESSSDTPPLTVVIAGDVAGDAVAYPLQASSSPTTSAATTSTAGRLLLGHTASMLTDVRVVNQQQPAPPLVITADRDETIRISHFPATHHIHGYLLGHTAFVSCLDTATVTRDAATTTVTILSASGDGMIRLWDGSSCQELARLEMAASKTQTTVSTTNETTPTPKQPEPSSQQQSRDAAQEEKDDDDENDDQDSSSSRQLLLPTNLVFVDRAGGLAAVIYDDSRSLDLVSIVHQETCTSKEVATNNNDDMLSLMTLSHRVECDTQPLGLARLGEEKNSFLVLLQEPPYLQVYQVLQQNNDSDSHPTLVPSTTWKNDWTQALLALSSNSDKSAESSQPNDNISMPTSLLERDKYGNLKMTKLSETRGPAAAIQKQQQADSSSSQRPWTVNASERKERARERNRRSNQRRKRARTTAAASPADGDPHGSNNNGDDGGDNKSK